jgi:predicted ATP-dependent serine protease
MEDHVDITKVMLIIYYISKEGKLPKPKLDHLVDLALVHYAEKTYVEN